MKDNSNSEMESSIHCPLCGSTSVTYKTGGYGGMIYRCKECGYMGAFVVEVDDDTEDAIQAAELSEERFQAPEAGGEKFQVPLWVKILAVLFVIVVILYVF
jgi:ribosomal protein L37AE/L43A